MLPASAMQAIPHHPARGDGHLWMISFMASLALNGVLVLLAGFAVIRSTVIDRTLAAAAPPPPTESEIILVPETVTPRPEATDPPVIGKRLARTSPDQAAPEESKNSVFIGERATQATSDRTPDAAAPPLPSQKGIQPKDGEMETTESRYQDGSLAGGPPAPDAAMPEPPAEPTPPAVAEPTPPAVAEPTPPAATASATPPATPGTDSERSVPPPREKLMEGPNPVDVQVPREAPKEETLKPTPEQRPRAEEAPPAPPKPQETAKPADAPKPKPAPEPEFKGYQRKTALVGSINRTGRSALDVEDSALGRYGIAISRAVELEFQRNCVRHRDYITPGFLTVRFFVEPSGKVRSVRLDSDMSTGEIQKGFTLNSIRNAEIPPMPKALGKEYAKEPLELVFRFYF